MRHDSAFKWVSVGVIWVWLAVFALVPSLMVFGASLLRRGEMEFFSFSPTLENYLRLFDPLLYIPMIILVVYSFNSSTYSPAWSGFTLNRHSNLFANSSLWEVKVNSLIIAILLSATLATVLGTVAAVSFHRYSFFGKKLLYGLIYILITSPDIVM
jgi:ABC-type spermidine/putrescine transport system permease subunit II